MLKTIKKKKNVSTNELFKYITMNAHTLLDGKKFHRFMSKSGHEVIIDDKGNVNFSFMHYTAEDLFEIEVEEEITEDTKFYLLVELYCRNEKYWSLNYMNSSINNVKDDTTISIHALIDGKLQLIWEAE